MKKRFKMLAGFVGVLMLVAIPSQVAANPDPVLEVSPTEHDFGNVEVDTSATTIVTISNVGGHDLVVTGISLSGSGDFVITSLPTLPAIIPPPNGTVKSIDVEVTYTPAELGYTSAVLEITSNVPVVQVALGGEGIDGGPTPVTIANIIAFFDQSVEDGTLDGRGPCDRAKWAQRRAFRFLLVAAGSLIEGGYYDWACFALERAYIRSDGLCRPPDFLVGDSKSELNAMIGQLMADMGCE